MYVFICGGARCAAEYMRLHIVPLPRSHVCGRTNTCGRQGSGEMPSRRRETDGAFRAALSEPTRVLLTLGGVQLTLGEGFGNPRRRLASQRARAIALGIVYGDIQRDRSRQA